MANEYDNKLEISKEFAFYFNSKEIDKELSNRVIFMLLRYRLTPFTLETFLKIENPTFLPLTELDYYKARGS